MKLYSILTRNCNLKCSHCDVSAGPEKEDETMSPNDFEKVVQNLEGEKSIKWTLTGGEIFTMRESLWGYLKVLQKRERQNRNSDKWVLVG